MILEVAILYVKPNLQELLHDYYEPFPTVNHYETVFENK